MGKISVFAKVVTTLCNSKGLVTRCSSGCMTELIAPSETGKNHSVLGEM